jgi:cell division protease FtsH
MLPIMIQLDKEYNFSKPYSEETARIIDKEISLLIEVSTKEQLNFRE